ncbi:MAG: 4-hydroxythreonine-4-phosphate dehydrogenase PdxA [Planctomycetes bacterium]|nr:4-hydroxythreonine-4-phosphate dehydrogenase PdxA [Planctomycetota bacterium]
MPVQTIAITMGEPTGIGPEVIVRALDATRELPDLKLLVIGNKNIITQTAAGLGIALPGSVTISEPEPRPATAPEPVQYILTAVKLAMAKKVSAVVTGPVSKEIINKAGYPFEGHTELLARQTNSRKTVMLFSVAERSPDSHRGVKNLKVALATRHLAYKKVPLNLSADNILTTITLTADGLKEYFGLYAPRIAVCGLNPHAGEGGLLGREEKEFIIPAVERAKKDGILAFGPWPADSVFHRALNGEFDAVVALYHDQGIIPVKTVSFYEAVQVTLGLPFIRTSVAHGTAFDIAGKGTANPSSMIEAVKLAAEMANRKRGLF